jgi:hypothetical protein
VHESVPRTFSDPGRLARPPNHHRQRATATPNKNATNSKPKGASRAMLLKLLSGIVPERTRSRLANVVWPKVMTIPHSLLDCADEVIEYQEERPQRGELSQSPRQA